MQVSSRHSSAQNIPALLQLSQNNWQSLHHGLQSPTGVGLALPLIFPLSLSVTQLQPMQSLCCSLKTPCTLPLSIFARAVPYVWNASPRPPPPPYPGWITLLVSSRLCPKSLYQWRLPWPPCLKKNIPGLLILLPCSIFILSAYCHLTHISLLSVYCSSAPTRGHTLWRRVALVSFVLCHICINTSDLHILDTSQISVE